MQVLEPAATGPRLNEAAEMLIVLPPTLIEMGVLKLHGTKEKVNLHVGMPTSNITQRTRVEASAKLGCRLGTADRLKKIRNAVGTTKNLGSSRIEDRRGVSHYNAPVHRDAIERCLPVTLADNVGISIRREGAMPSDHNKPHWSRGPR